MEKMARPEGFEPPTLCLEGRRSFQLSYGRTLNIDSKSFMLRANTILKALTLCHMGGGSVGRQLRTGDVENKSCTTR